MPEKEESLIAAHRKPEFSVDPLFVNRWSPRAMSGEEIALEELHSLFEAARWAPSASNNQPWRFIYARRDTPAWKTLFDLMLEFNQSWTRNAAALVVIVSKKTFDIKETPSRTHSFDAGAAWQNLALQGSLRGLVVHGMAGFDYDRARKDLAVPDNHDIEAMVAVGKPGPVEGLPAALQKREVPSDRKKIAEIVFEGRFKS